MAEILNSENKAKNLVDNSGKSGEIAEDDLQNGQQEEEFISDLDL